MGDIKPSKIVCKNCGYESNVISDVCIKCGGKLVKVCGNCGWENSVEKMYCDNCGSLLALTPHKKIYQDEEDEKKEDVKKSNINIEFESITETILKKDESYRKKKEENEKSVVKEEKKEASSVIEEKKKIEEYISKKKNENTEVKDDKKESNLSDKKKTKLNLYIIGFFVIVFIFLLYFFVLKNSISKYKLLFTAKSYLTYLRDGDYEKAYSYLSNNSKSLISLDDYIKTSKDYYSNVGKWDFKDVSICYYSENQSIIKYRLFEKGEWKDDYINFIKEYGLWRRPYVWNLFEKIDYSFSNKDFSKALYYSQLLYLIDPLDPRSSGYLCWSEYMNMLFDKSVDSCKRVIKISSLYPVKYYNNEDLFWYKFNYADSLRFLNRDDEALKNFNELAEYNEVSLASKCGVYSARSDIFIHKKDYEKALADLNIALSICRDVSVVNDVNKRISMLKGLDCQGAIDFLKNYKYKNLKFNDFVNQIDPNPNYFCKHIEGPVYEVRVILKKKKKIVSEYSSNIDLWNKTINIEEVKSEKEI
jgi:tetratricopeptide (TPR) repeat protein